MEIPIKEFVKLLLKRSWFILIIAVCGVMLGFAAYKARNTDYSSGASIVINYEDNSDGKTLSTDTIVNTCVSILSGNGYIKEQAESIGVFRADGERVRRGVYGVRELNENLTVARESGSFVIVISFVGATPEIAYNMTRLISENAGAEISKVLPGKDIGVTLFSPAVPAEAVGSTSPLPHMLTGGILGVLIASAGIVVLRITDKRVYSSREITENYDLPFLGEI